jgi:hypothetical protein
MKKMILLLLFTSMAFSSIAYDGDIEFEQKDGVSFTGNLKGDEWFSWIEDKSGNIIKYNTLSKNYEYATIKDVNGTTELVPSGTKVTNTINSDTTLLNTNSNKLFEIWQQKRKEALKVSK